MVTGPAPRQWGDGLSGSCPPSSNAGSRRYCTFGRRSPSTATGFHHRIEDDDRRPPGGTSWASDDVNRRFRTPESRRRSNIASLTSDGVNLPFRIPAESKWQSQNADWWWWWHSDLRFLFRFFGRSSIDDLLKREEIGSTLTASSTVKSSTAMRSRRRRHSRESENVWNWKTGGGGRWNWTLEYRAAWAADCLARFFVRPTALNVCTAHSTPAGVDNYRK